MDLKPSPSNHAKYFLKTLSMTVPISRPCFMTKQCTVQKIYSVIYSNSCSNTHDIATFKLVKSIENTFKVSKI